MRIGRLEINWSTKRASHNAVYRTHQHNMFGTQVKNLNPTELRDALTLLIGKIASGHRPVLTKDGTRTIVFLDSGNSPRG